MTKSLEELTKSEIHVQETQPLETVIGVSHEMVPGPLVQRSKVLRSENEAPLLFGQSWWNAGIYEEIMKEPEVPIWYNFEQKGIIPVRKILGLFFLYSPELQEKLGRNEEGFLGREYVFTHHDRILTAVMEIVGIASMRKLL